MLTAAPEKATLAIVDELLPLLMAGREPAAAALSWIVDRLARNPELAEHFLTSPPDDPLRTATVREALRLRPAVHTVAPRPTRPRSIGGHELPAGAVASVSIVLVQRDPDASPDPDDFRPERFLDANIDELPYLPFGAERAAAWAAGSPERRSARSYRPSSAAYGPGRSPRSRSAWSCAALFSFRGGEKQCPCGLLVRGPSEARRASSRRPRG